MAVGIFVTQKTCASCEYWGGQRSIKKNPALVEAESFTSKGQCMGTGPWRGMNKEAQNSCNKYQKWRFLG